MTDTEKKEEKKKKKDKIKKVTTKEYYCKHCEKDIKKPKRRSFDEMEKTILVIVFIIFAGVGIAIIGSGIVVLNFLYILAGVIIIIIGILAWKFYNKFIRKPVFCPDCESRLEITKKKGAPKKSEAKKEEDKTPKEEVLEKVGEVDIKEEPREIPEDAEKIFCPFCGHELEADIATCPYCATAIKF